MYGNGMNTHTNIYIVTHTPIGFVLSDLFSVAGIETWLTQSPIQDSTTQQQRN